jgi:hypothetical protein
MPMVIGLIYFVVMTIITTLFYRSLINWLKQLKKSLHNVPKKMEEELIEMNDDTVD